MVYIYMSLFSERLSYYIKKSRLTLLYLSSISGIDVSYISKIKKGERLPKNREQLVPLVNGLRLSPSEKQELWDAYKISSIGEKTFQQYASVKRLLSSMNSTGTTSIASSYHHDIQSVSALYGTPDINNTTKAILELEAAKKDGYIKIVAQPDYRFLIDLLGSIIASNPSLDISHLLCLQSGSDLDKIVYNIESFQNLFPLLSLSENYQVKFYYDEITSHLNQMSVMPFFILTSTYTILLAPHYDLADISDDPERHKLYSHIFRKMYSLTEDLIFPITETTTIDDMFQIESSTDSMDIIEFSAIPSLLSYYPEKSIRDIVKRDAEDQETKIQNLLENPHTFKNFPIKHKRYFSLFTEDTFLQFLQTGYFPGLPQTYCNPMDPADTIVTFKKLCTEPDSINHIPLMLKSGQISFNSSTRIIATSRNNMLLFISHYPGFGDQNFRLMEQSLVSSIKDFLEYLLSSDEVYSIEETKTFIQKQISRLEKNLRESRRNRL